MNIFPWWWSSTFILTLALLLIDLQGSTLTFVNKCNYTVWPATTRRSGELKPYATGFELLRESSRSFQFPTGLFTIWARTGCKLDQFGSWTCQTGDCGTGLVECNGNLYSKPVTMADIALGGTDLQDYYLVSLADGFNVPMNLVNVGGTGSCGSVGCNVDLNRLCPVELALKGGKGCMEPCQALGISEYCCTGAYNANSMCGPNVYSEMFRAACPRSDMGFTCEGGGDFVLTFCPFPSYSSYEN